MKLLKLIIYPIVFLIVFPIEYSCWKAYRKRQRVPNYFKWVWIRTFGTLEQNLTLIK